MTGAPGAVRGLRRFVAPRQAAAERCELCGVPVDERHRHLVDGDRRAIVCACVPCALLFDREGAGAGRFRTIPDRRLRAPGWSVDAAGWGTLGIPVSLAFFFRNSALGRVVALYPSPAGATESEVDQDAFDAVFGTSPLAAALTPDVEALLVRRGDGNRGGAGHGDVHLVPVDAAYELVGRLRSHWRGFDGGSDAHRELDAFFADLARTARPVPPLPDGGAAP
ncbi:DUF5947 family protein [Streptomyces sp. NPDC050560]|uniref:DUF5947 family protein n=1 Tax=Streptomyces sp. NPDC050560 TaxID=3365630 RepID=UPI0037922E77